MYAASEVCSSGGEILVCALWASCHRELTVWQVRVGTVAADAVHSRAPTAKRCLAGEPFMCIWCLWCVYASVQLKALPRQIELIGLLANTVTWFLSLQNFLGPTEGLNLKHSCEKHVVTGVCPSVFRLKQNQKSIWYVITCRFTTVWLAKWHHMSGDI